MATMTIEGRRVYIKTQYGEACVDKLIQLGAHWDGDRNAWWLTSAKRAEVERIINAPGANKLSSHAAANLLKRDQNHILGRVKYDGHTYYLVGEGSKDGRPWMRLMFRDGSKTFFAKEVSQVAIVKRYEGPRTLRGLQEYAERMKREAAGGPCECWCHTARNADCVCETRGFCPFHHDGCDSCGCES